MPLVLFVGVNHHGQSIVFACALLGRESVKDYKWCISRFLECMGGVKPGGILTDQCGSIETGVRHVFGAEIVHRYCSWHILHKLTTKWDPRDMNKSGKTRQVKKVVYESHTRQQFEKNWAKLMKNLGKQNDPWFTGIYQMREKWVPAFLNTYFWAGMTTTQRVESMNALLKTYLTRRESLQDFVSNFEEGLVNIWEREHKKDHESKYKAPKVHSELSMEYQFQAIYTNEIFMKCQQQFKLCISLSCKIIEEHEEEALYVVTDCSNKPFHVLYKRCAKEIFCICGMFEVMGIVFSHSIEYLKIERVLFIDEKYFVDRWRNDICRENLTICDPSHPTLPEQNRLYQLTISTNLIIQDLLNIGSVSDKLHNDVVNGLKELKDKIQGAQQYDNINVNSGIEKNASKSVKKRNSSTGRRIGRVSVADTSLPVSTAEVIHADISEPVVNASSETSTDELRTDLHKYLNDLSHIVVGVDMSVSEFLKRRISSTSKRTEQDVTKYNINVGSAVLIATSGESTVVEVHHGENDQSLVKSLSSVEQQPTSIPNSLVNCAPSFALLSPAKSKQRGRPRKSTIKSKLDISVKEMIDKKKKNRLKGESNSKDSALNENNKRRKRKEKLVVE